MSATGNPGHGNKLARKREAAIAALLSSPSLKSAASKAGVSEKTLRGWMQLPDFKEQYNAARKECLFEAMRALQAGSTKAVRTLVRALQAGKDDVKVRAALGLLAQAWKSFEQLEVEPRLRILEDELVALRKEDEERQKRRNI